MGNRIIMKRASVLLVVTASLGGCAYLRGPKGPSAEVELQRGIAAIRSQNYTAARDILEPVYRAHYMDKAGQQALLMLTIADLDPRNQDRRLYAASDYASSLLNSATTPQWEIGVAETLYLLSQELGGHEQELDRAEAEKQQAQQTVAALKRQITPPRYQGESWPSQLRKMREDRDALSKKVDQLQASLKARDKDLAEANAELERIKKTLKIK
jgi:hypothetical protein